MAIFAHCFLTMKNTITEMMTTSNTPKQIYRLTSPPPLMGSSLMLKS